MWVITKKVLMINTSQRGQDIGDSPIRSLFPFAQQAKATGKHVFHLNIGQPDIPTPPTALNVLRTKSDSIVKYGLSEGLTELRVAVAEYYDKFDAKISYDHVYVTTGASEAILFALYSCCDRGDEVIIPEPFYANYLGFAHMADVTIVPITTRLEDEFQLPSPEQFDALVTDKTKAIFLCNPGNPTGQMYSADELAALMQIVKKHKLFLIVDEVYREFCYDQAFKSVLAFDDMAEHVLVIDSISKVFSSCGARVGYLITKNKAVLSIVNKYAQLRLCPPSFGQQLALACYDAPERYIADAKIEYIKRRDVLYQELSKIDGIKFFKPTAAFYNIVELPVDDAAAFCQWLLTDFEHNGNTVMLSPANGFYANQALGKRQVRIAYILNENDLRQAIECLGVALGEYNKLASL